MELVQRRAPKTWGIYRCGDAYLCCWPGWRMEQTYSSPLPQPDAYLGTKRWYFVYATIVSEITRIRIGTKGEKMSAGPVPFVYSAGGMPREEWDRIVTLFDTDPDVFAARMLSCGSP